MINFALSREIYGIVPWMMDIHSIPVMNTVLGQFSNGNSFESPEEKYNSLSSYNFKNETRLITRPYGSSWYPGELQNQDDFEGIGVINLNGPITKNGGASSYGMDYVSSLMLKMYQDKRIIAFMIISDSGGGSSSAVEIMNDTINLIKQTKPVHTLIPKGALTASAAYGIVSGSTTIHSESKMNMVGSCGTMIQFEGRKANSVKPDGTQTVRLYATKSIRKNEGFEEALNKGNFEILVNDFLDPINQNFLDMIESNRPAVKNVQYDDGRTLFAQDAVGSLIDGFSTFEDVVSMIVSDYKKGGSKKGLKSTTNININNKKMTKAEFKSEHPKVYASIVEDGVKSEKDRVGAWMAWFETDPEAVSKGIESGEIISQTQRESLIVKASSKGKVAKMKSDSTQPINTPESKTEEEIKNEEIKKEVEAAFGFELK